MGQAIVMAGATGAVGGAFLSHLARRGDVSGVTALGRRKLGQAPGLPLRDLVVDVGSADGWSVMGAGQDVAICTLGVGQPTKVARAAFVQIDRDAPLAFARACKAAGVRHFQILGSVGANARSASFFLRTKGELEEGLRALDFERLSLFRPSMILTPENRYGVSQAVTLAVWPWLTPLLAGPLRRYRGVPIDRLGAAMAANIATPGQGVEVIEWDGIMALSGTR